MKNNNEIRFKVTPEQKALIKKQASLGGETMSGFARRVVLEAARKQEAENKQALEHARFIANRKKCGAVGTFFGPRGVGPCEYISETSEYCNNRGPCQSQKG